MSLRKLLAEPGEPQPAPSQKKKRYTPKREARGSFVPLAIRKRKEAEELGKRSVADTVQFLVDMRDGVVPGSTATDRVRASENLLDRFGFPRLTQQEFKGEDVPMKLVDLRLANAAKDQPVPEDAKDPEVDAEPAAPETAPDIAPAVMDGEAMHGG